jgi:hypothetical protein
MAVFLIILTVILLLLMASGMYLNYFALSKAYHDRHSTNLAGDEIYLSTKEEMNELTATGEKVVITAFDSIRLTAYYRAASAPTHKYVIAMHGYHGNPYEMAHFAFHIQRSHGFNILVPAQRSHGESEGRHTTMGFKEKFDLKSWIEYLVAKDKDAEILLFGISMGSATVTGTSNLGLPKNVKAIIADCGYSSCEAEFRHEIKAFMHLPPFPFLNIASLLCRIQHGFFYKDVDSISAVRESKIPTLFIHGDADTFVPFRMLDEIYEAAACPKEKLVIHGAKHAKSEMTDSATYWKAVDGFLSRYMK